MKKSLYIILISILVVTNICSAFASPTDMKFDGINYIQTDDTSVTFKNNFWHSGFQEADMVLPIREKWSVPIGDSKSQPVINGNYLYTLAGGQLVQVDIKNHNKTGYIGNVPSDSHITLIKNSDGTFGSDMKDRLVFGTSNGKVYCIKLSNASIDESCIEWVFDTSTGKSIKSSPVFCFDSISKKPYIVFGSEDKNLYVVDMTGHLVQKISEDGPIKSSPMVYPTDYGDKTYSSFAYGVDSTDTKGGYVSAGTMINGTFYKHPLFNKTTASNFKMAGIPTTLSSQVMNIGEQNQFVTFNTDKEGNIYCISLHTGVLLFKISKYQKPGGVVIENSPCVDEDYLYITFTNYNLSGKAKFVAIDYKKAISLGASNPYSSTINSAIVFESDDNEFTGQAHAGADIVRLVIPGENGSTSIKGKVAFVGDSGTSNNFRAIHIDKSVGKAVRVKDSFQVYDDSKKQYVTTDSLTFPGGCSSEPLYSNQFLFVTDGRGTLHALSATLENNLALVNMRNDKYPVQRGKQYEMSANIVNYSGKETVPLDIKYTILDEGNKIIAEAVLNDQVIPANGLTSHLKYTVPQDYKGNRFYLKCEVNSQDSSGKRKYVESIEGNAEPYKDNTITADLPIADGANFIVSSSGPLSYRENLAVTTNVTFKNDSDYDFVEVPVKIRIDGTNVNIETKINLRAHESVSYPVVWNTPKVANDKTSSTLYLHAYINYDRDIEEQEYQENYRKFEINIIKDLPDLEIVSISPVNYLANKRVITLVKVRNNSDTDYVGDSKVGMKFSLNSSSKTEMVELKAHSERMLPYTWNTPSGGKVTISAEVNYDRSIAESDYSNNKKSITATINKQFMPDPPDDGEVPIINPPNSCSNTRRDWKEWRIVGWDSDGNPIWELISFYAIINSRSNVNPTEMKSGYGFECTVTTSIDTNYDDLSKIVGPQSLYAYFPEYQYSVPIELYTNNLRYMSISTPTYGVYTEKVTKDLYHTTWTFNVNDASVTGNRNHFIPVWFPDNTNYIVQFSTNDAQCPGGSLCSSSNSSIMINGNMYQDDTTGSTR